MIKDFLECAEIINKRGINGELKLYMLCDGIQALEDVKYLYTDNEGKNSYEVISLKTYKGFLYVKLKGIDSAEKADAMRGKTLYASRDDIYIDEERVFIADLLDLPVVDADTGKVYGIVNDIFNSGSVDIYSVIKDSKEYLMPATPDILVEAIPGDKVLVRPIPGIFDDAEELR